MSYDLDACLDQTQAMIDRHYPDLMPGRKMLANDNRTHAMQAAAETYSPDPLALSQAALAYVTPAEAAMLNEARHRYITDMIKDLFSYIRVMPDDMAIAELEAIADETDQTVNFFKEKDRA